MKQRYILRTFVEASSPLEALKLGKKTSPHEVYLDTEVWKEKGYALKESDNKLIGFQAAKRP